MFCVQLACEARGKSHTIVQGVLFQSVSPNLHTTLQHAANNYTIYVLEAVAALWTRYVVCNINGEAASVPEREQWSFHFGFKGLAKDVKRHIMNKVRYSTQTGQYSMFTCLTIQK